MHVAAGIDTLCKPMQANKVQLSATVATQVEAARSGMSLLDKAHKTLGNMQNSYKVWWSSLLLSTRQCEGVNDPDETPFGCR